MANDQGQAEAAPSITTPAAESTTTHLQPERIAGVEGTEAVTTSAGTRPTETSITTMPAGETAAAEGFDSLLAGTTTSDDILRLTGTLPPAVPPGTSAEPSPVDPEDPANLQQGTALPDRLRIKNLPPGHKEIILKLLQNQNATPEELAAILSPPGTRASSATAASPVAPAVDAPAVITQPRPAEIDPAALAPPAESSANIQSQIRDVQRQQLAAQRGADLDRAADLGEQIIALQERLPGVRQAERTYKAAVDQAWTASERQAIHLYPDATNPESPIVREMERLEQQLVARRDPLAGHPNSPLLLAVQAATNLGIAPGTRSTQVTPTAAAPGSAVKPVPVASPTPRAAVPGAIPPSPAPGGARTQAPSPAAATAQFEQVLESAKDTNDILALTRSL